MTLFRKGDVFSLHMSHLRRLADSNCWTSTQALQGRKSLHTAGFREALSPTLAAA